MVPYTPSNIVLQTGNGTNFITWDLVVGATSYSVQRSVDGINFNALGTATTNNYLDSAVLIGTNYYYQVASVNLSGTSAYVPSSPVSITPCLAGQINLGYLRYQAQLRADKLNSNYLTIDEWNANINQSIYELYDILVTKFGDDYFFAPPLQIPLTGQVSYTLPDGALYSAAPACYKLIGVDGNLYGGAISGPTSGWVPLARFNVSDRDRYLTWPGQAGALNNIYQMAYRIMGNQLYIIPFNTNMYIQLWYVPVMTQLLRDTDMLSFSISGWSEYVIIDAAMKAMIKEESLEKWNALAACKSLQMDRISTTAANRDVGQPNTVSNVRSVMGDPGFSGFGGYGSQGFGGFGS